MLYTTVVSCEAKRPILKKGGQKKQGGVITVTILNHGKAPSLFAVTVQKPTGQKMQQKVQNNVTTFCLLRCQKQP